jgi:hypothetical protein
MESLKVLANLIAYLLSVSILSTEHESIDHHIKLYEQTRILFAIIFWNWLLIAQKRKKNWVAGMSCSSIDCCTSVGGYSSLRWWHGMGTLCW